ncbi:MAG: phage major capsid protein [Alphaproteobacteria bacterium]|nr:phage major capsid protein [Alphaproteobacteria bacterium]
MSIQEITERVHSLGNAWEQFKQVNDARLKEIERKGHADPLYEEHLRRISDALDNNKRRMDQIETVHGRLGGDVSGKSFEDASEYKSAFRNYLRKGMDAGLEQIQLKALSVGTDADGGYLVTNQMSESIMATIKETSPLRALARVETISSDSLDVIEDTSEMSAAWVAETAARSETNTPAIGKNSIEVHEMYAQPQATQKLIDDASIDIEAWVAQRIAEKFARLEATAFVSGDGSGKPKGILSYTAGANFGEIEQINSGTSAVVTADGLIKLYYALKDDHAKRATFLMHRTTVQAVRLLKEATTNQYLWQPGLAAGTPDTLLGVPVALASDMPAPAASSLSVAIADFQSAYLIVDRVGVRLLRDPYTAKPFVKFYATKRVGGEVVNTEAVKLLKLAV